MDQEMEDETPSLHISLHTSWSLEVLFKPDYTIKRVINEVKTRLMAYTAELILCFLGSLEEETMLMFNGKDLLDHPSRTLQELGIKDNDNLTIMDKRPFMIKISMQDKKNTDEEVEIEAQDTVYSVKAKIEALLRIPVEKQRLCYVDKELNTRHFSLLDDSTTLAAYGIAKGWMNLKPRLWVYTDDDLALEETHWPPVPSPYSSSRTEIIIQVCQKCGDEFFCVSVESWYTVNQLMRIIRGINPAEESWSLEDYWSFHETWMLVFQGQNLLEHGSSTLGDLGIKDHDRLLIPEKVSFPLPVILSSSSFGQQRALTLEVGKHVSVLTLKKKIESVTDIPIQRQRLCYMCNGTADEECHLLMTDDSRALETYGIVKLGNHTVVCIEDDCRLEKTEDPHIYFSHKRKVRSI